MLKMSFKLSDLFPELIMTSNTAAPAPAPAPAPTQMSSPAPASLTAGVQPQKNINVASGTQVLTPGGTISLSITPPPATNIPLYANPVLWVAIISLVGVVLTLWQARNRLKRELSAAEDRLQKQLDAAVDESKIERDQSREQAKLDREHNVEQAHQERITKARREVYLELISEITKARVELSSLPAQEVQDIDVVSRFSGLIAATSKISLLGEMRTVAHSRTLLSTIQETLANVLVLLIPMSRFKDEKKFHEKELPRHNEKFREYEVLVEKYKDHYSTDANDVRRLFNHHYNKIQEHTDGAIAASRSLIAESRKYNELLVEEMIRILRQADELVHSMRDELNLHTSVEQLSATTEALHQAMKAAVQRMNARLDNADITDPIQEQP